MNRTLVFYKQVALLDRTVEVRDRIVPENTCWSSAFRWAAGRLETTSDDELIEFQQRYESEHQLQLQQQLFVSFVSDPFLSDLGCSYKEESLNPMTLPEFSSQIQTKIEKLNPNQALMVLLNFKLPSGQIVGHWIGLNYDSLQEQSAFFNVLNSPYEITSNTMDISKLVVDMIQDQCVEETSLMGIYPSVYTF